MKDNNEKGFAPNRMTYIIIISGFVISMLFNYWLHRPKSDQNNEIKTEQSTNNPVGNSSNKTENSQDISEKTREGVVVNYVKQNHELPDFYITKSEAKRQGWNPSAGNLCDVLPGKAIGGDKFSNREKTLPKGGQYYEADVNYNCGNRGADRIVFTKNGDVWLTKDHYKSFQKQ